jgi:hypothetical protein
MRCPHCKTPMGLITEIQGGAHADLQPGAAGFCPMCDWNLTWDGEKWVAGDRNKNWWERTQ